MAGIAQRLEHRVVVPVIRVQFPLLAHTDKKQGFYPVFLLCSLKIQHLEII